MWPILAPLDCIGCYHTHLERACRSACGRDLACTSGVEPAHMHATLAAMIAGRPYNWLALRQSLQRLQARMIKLARYHPAPPERLFRSQLANNEQLSNQIYRITEQMGGMLRDMYHSNTVKVLTSQVQDLQADLFAARYRWMKPCARPYRRQEPALYAGANARADDQPDFAAQRADADTTAMPRGNFRAMDRGRCDRRRSATASAGDARRRGKVQLRLSWIAETDTALQVYWAIGDCGFSPG